MEWSEDHGSTRHKISVEVWLRDVDNSTISCKNQGFMHYDAQNALVFAVA